MEILYKSSHIQEKTVVALGFFDGVHIAHCDLIQNTVKIAKEKGLKSVVYTFNKSVKPIKLITQNCEKTECIRKLGVDCLIFEETNEEFLHTSPESFVENILRDKLNASIVIVGKHYTFGHKGIADSNDLKRLCSEKGIETIIMPLMEIENFLVSSTHIRFFIECGEMEKVKQFLGRNFALKGEIEHGNKIGRSIGFPTINIYPKKEMVVPRYGVYLVKVYVDNKEYEGIANVGVKPTVGSDKVVVEANLFDMEEKQLYKEIAKIEFLSFIRTEKTFGSLELLKEQIQKDKEFAKEYFKEKR